MCVDIASLRWVVASKWLHDHGDLHHGPRVQQGQKKKLRWRWSGQIEHEFKTTRSRVIDFAFTSEISFFRSILVIIYIVVIVLFSSWGHPANPCTGIIDGMNGFSLKLRTKRRIHAV